MKNQSRIQDPNYHPRWSTSGKQTMTRLDKVIGIPARITTQDTEYVPEYTIIKPHLCTHYCQL